nr:3-hydroxyacyl-thioester dehydratase Z-like [Nerophis lumbriciformis]
MPIVVPAQQLSNYVGQEQSSDEWFQIDQQRIDDFADVTLDHQFIHVDPARAAETPFGTTIAHGLLTLSLLPKLIEPVMVTPENVVMGINYGFNKVRFPHPVTVGSRVRAVMTLRCVEEREPKQFMLQSDIVVEIERKSKPAVAAQSLALVIVG